EPPLPVVADQLQQWTTGAVLNARTCRPLFEFLDWKRKHDLECDNDSRCAGGQKDQANDAAAKISSKPTGKMCDRSGTQ
ncbi:MAG: hypothetical protein ACKVHE_29495, partial [Planctomycetales bacterium]